MDKVLVTGAAGFIGMFTTKRLLEDGYKVIGIDNVNDYYDQSLKEDRLKILNEYDNFTFIKGNLADNDMVKSIFEDNNIKYIIHLAAQAGVRYSLINPQAYVESNINAFVNILEAAKSNEVRHLIYASSSSVYGANKKTPFSTSDDVDHPVSLYAATKKSNELMAHTYSHLYNLPTTGLRFFTVYGPMGRPDMAYFSFSDKIINNEPIQVFNHGNMRRDFTYIDDIVDGIISLLDKIPTRNECNYDYLNMTPEDSYAPYRVYNLGNNKPVELKEFIETLEKHLGKTAEKEYLPMQPGDVKETYADIDKISEATGYSPTTSIDVGLEQFVKWYKDYYNI